MDELTERIVALEIRYTHQASLLEELNVELTLGYETPADKLQASVASIG